MRVSQQQQQQRIQTWRSESDNTRGPLLPTAMHSIQLLCSLARRTEHVPVADLPEHIRHLQPVDNHSQTVVRQLSVLLRPPLAADRRRL